MNPVLSLVERVLGRAKSSSDIVLALVMALIIGAMIVPLPGWLLDVGIAVNLAAALALLVAALYSRDALQVAAFPTLLLLTTLFRLAMNVSSTRLALSEGYAGEVIQAFGDFVVRGDYVVGAVVFAILTLVQFMVVAKGAERVAEVSARFTLDAMPGKQMSIDADLRSGAIDQSQARSRRRELERESQLFGSMDGAMKFVKGDVIAGFVIVLVNLVGGIAIGVVQRGMTAAQAAQTYALISIGDGLVSQIPSLCIAVAAGIVVTRVASAEEESSLGADIGAQFFGQWNALLVVAGLCVLLALMPGMPHLTFLGIAALATLASLGLRRLALPSAQPAAENRAKSAASPPANSPDLEALSGVAPLILDLAPNLTWAVEEDHGAFASIDLDRVRERLYFELGVKAPPFRVRTDAPLPPGGWTLALDEIPVGRAQVGDGRLFANTTPQELLGFGIQATSVADPSTGRPISIITSEARPRLEAAQVPVVGVRQLIADHLVVLLRRRAALFLGIQEVQAMLNALEPQAPALVKEALAKVPLPLMTEVLRRLLQEHVSVRNLRAILEALVSPAAEGDAVALAERCRQALARQISYQYAAGGPLYAYLVDPGVEEKLRAPQGAMDPADASAILEGVKRIARQGRAVLLSSPEVRRVLRRLVEGPFPDVAVLTFGELDPELQVRPLGRLAAVLS